MPAQTDLQPQNIIVCSDGYVKGAGLWPAMRASAHVFAFQNSGISIILTHTVMPWASEVADNFLASIAQDIVERFDDMSTQNLREALEACLLLTDTKCNVRDPLQKEFNAKQLTLGQYLLKKHQ